MVHIFVCFFTQKISLNYRQIPGSKMPTQKAEAAVCSFSVRQKPRPLATRALVDAHPHDRGSRRTTPASCRTPNPPKGASACFPHPRLARRRFPRRRVVRCRISRPPRDPSLTSPSPPTQVPVPRQGASPGAAGARERQLPRAGTRERRYPSPGCPPRNPSLVPHPKPARRAFQKPAPV